ncbi:interferon-stimulated 20 kDa exonuclease-like 2 [Ambystoma mexicanum]|uniref:interferon-stimulated 20 kDa exonuclease-like 2 n=1 Tax=Ambystoma mexicanum TaxID=8296 RepID=UPI0037E7EAFF
MSGLMLNLDASGSHPTSKSSHDHSNLKHKRFLKRRRFLEKKGLLKQKQLPQPSQQQPPGRSHHSQVSQLKTQQTSDFRERSKNTANSETSTNHLVNRNFDRNANSYKDDNYSHLLPQHKMLPRTNYTPHSVYRDHRAESLTVTVDSKAHNSRMAYFPSSSTKARGHGSANPTMSQANNVAHRVYGSHSGGNRINLMNEYESGLPPVTGTELPYRFVAIDCEMVGTGPGGRRSELARCTVVSYHGDVVYDKYIQPPDPITDFRTRWSGIRKQHMKNATPFRAAQKEILKILCGKVVVGHAIHNDFKALNYFHPNSLTRDTSRIPLLNKMAGFNEKESVSLKRLTKQLLNRDIQVGKNGHSSVEDAKATIELYRIVEDEWERELASNPVQD